MSTHTKLSQICSYGLFSKGLKNEFETTMVNEPSVFKPLKFYCTCNEHNCFMLNKNISHFELRLIQDLCVYEYIKLRNTLSLPVVLSV